MGKIVKMLFDGQTLPEMNKWTEYLCLLKKCSQGKSFQVGCLRINNQSHMTEMATMAIETKNLKYLLQNQKAYDFETCHEASDNRALQSLYKS